MTGDLGLPPAYRLVALETVGSTNDEAKRLARAGAEDGTIVWAKAQTEGRGRSGRTWRSLPGNLYASLVLRPECTPAEAGQLSFVAALGAGGALASLMPPLVELKYKWPNDLLINGRKVGGILLETESTGRDRLDWVVLGIGINVANHPDDTETPATSLHAEGDTDITVEATLSAFARYFLNWVNRWLDDGFEPVRQAWRRDAKGIGEPIRVRLPDRELHGTFVDIATDGALLLRTADGIVRPIAAGDVFFTGPAKTGASD